MPGKFQMGSSLAVQEAKDERGEVGWRDAWWVCRCIFSLYLQQELGNINRKRVYDS